MKCPYCGNHFKVIGLAGDPLDLPVTVDVIPVVCAKCSEVSLLENGVVRKVTDEEMEAIKASPAWELIKPALEAGFSLRKSISAPNN